MRPRPRCGEITAFAQKPFRKGAYRLLLKDVSEGKEKKGKD